VLIHASSTSHTRNPYQYFSHLWEKHCIILLLPIHNAEVTVEAAWSGNPGKLSLVPRLIPKQAQGFGITFYASKKQGRSLGTGTGICVCFGIMQLLWPKLQITCRGPHVQSSTCFVPVPVIWRMDFGRVSGCRDHARTTDRMSLKS